MKKQIGFVLALTLVVSLFSGCAGERTAAEPSMEAITEAVTEVITEPTTEPTLSAEEQLVASLSERTRQAYELGIVPLDMLWDLERVCSVAEAAQMVQNARVLMYGGESEMMAAAMESGQKDLPLTRFWMIQAMHISEVERFDSPPFTDYYSNLAYMTWGADNGPIWNDIYAGVSITPSFKEAYFAKWLAADDVTAHSYWIAFGDSLECIWPDSERKKAENLVRKGADEALEWEEGTFYSNGSQAPIDWGVRAYDRTTGAKLLAADEENKLNPAQEMTVGQAVELALRYYHYRNSEAQMLSYGDMPAFDSSIITQEHLDKQTTLPEVSCTELPSGWRGVYMGDLLTSADGGNKSPNPDMKIYENEIQLIKDAGFNFVKIFLDFRFYHAENEDFFYGTKPERGMMNETYLKELDQIIAWCMERDIHVNLCCINVVGWPQGAVFGQAKNAQPMAEQWAVFARRYAQIPNTYLSFTLYDNPDIRYESHYEKFFPPVVEAIRAESPERCIIADISGNCTGESMAKLGVALASSAVWPEAFYISTDKSVRNTTYQMFEKASWPFEQYGKIYNAEQAMTNRVDGWVAPDAVAAVAKQYGVGYMVNQWASTTQHGGNVILRERYGDSCMEGYLEDFAQVLEGRGYGWCYGNWSGFTGIACPYPAVRSAEYTRVDGAPLYRDEKIIGWFQEING